MCRRAGRIAPPTVRPDRTPLVPYGLRNPTPKRTAETPSGSLRRPRHPGALEDPSPADGLETLSLHLLGVPRKGTTDFLLHRRSVDFPPTVSLVSPVRSPLPTPFQRSSGPLRKFFSLPFLTTGLRTLLCPCSERRGTLSNPLLVGTAPLETSSGFDTGG